MIHFSHFNSQQTRSWCVRSHPALAGIPAAFNSFNHFQGLPFWSQEPACFLQDEQAIISADTKSKTKVSGLFQTSARRCCASNTEVLTTEVCFTSLRPHHAAHRTNQKTALCTGLSPLDFLPRVLHTKVVKTRFARMLLPNAA